MKKLILFIIALTITASATARIYVYEANDGTKYYTEGMPLGLTKAEKAENWDKLYRKEVDALTPVTLSNREGVKAIYKADNETPPDPITCPDGQHLNSAGDGCDDDAIVEPPMHGDMPVVDTSKEITPAIGSSIRDIVAAQEPSSPAQEKGGAVRFFCDVSHMSNNDPIVYPNQEGASHHHTFFGNTGANHASTPESIRNSGNGTCSGGIANRSAYWVPSMLNMVNGVGIPLKPIRIGLYYKTDEARFVKKLPKGLRMIAKPHLVEEATTRFQCVTANGNNDLNYKEDEFPTCKDGQQMKYSLDFPTCWDGVNLDSPNHTDHVIYNPKWQADCPASHPHKLPSITFNVFYRVGSEGTTNWRLASDPIGEPAGYSVHGDWFNGWDETVSDTFVEHCLQAGRDCHGDLLGDGTALKSIDD